MSISACFISVFMADDSVDINNIFILMYLQTAKIIGWF